MQELKLSETLKFIKTKPTSVDQADVIVMFI